MLGDGSAVVIHEEFAGSDPVDVAAAAHVTAAGRKDATAPPVGLEAHDTTR